MCRQRSRRDRWSLRVIEPFAELARRDAVDAVEEVIAFSVSGELGVKALMERESVEDIGLENVGGGYGAVQQIMLAVEEDRLRDSLPPLAVERAATSEAPLARNRSSSGAHVPVLDACRSR